MRYERTIYPVDRYLVESSKRIDMINIVDDGIWNPEPALTPEDEIILRKLHDMLQSTADDLKLLSGELSKYHEPGVQKKSLPTPLDEEFNEKVHIEEIVKAKFHGHRIIDNMKPIRNEITTDGVNLGKASTSNSTKKVINANVQFSRRPLVKNTNKKLSMSGTKTIHIAGTPASENHFIDKKLGNKHLQTNKPSKVSYTELSYKHTEPIIQTVPHKPLQLQQLPSISIRSQLKEQKVLHLDILPDKSENQEKVSARSNALVVEMKYETPKQRVSKSANDFDHVKLTPNASVERTKRKISVIPAYESSESTNNTSFESQHMLMKQKQKNVSIRPLTNLQLNLKTKDNINSKKNVKNPHSDLADWNRRLAAVYGGTSKHSPKKGIVKKTNKRGSDKQQIKSKDFNNAEYVPYSKLTLGGVSVSDIEREISNLRNRNDVVLSPILDKILSSHENSFNKDSPKTCKDKNTKILTTSDENLLEEVLDIEKNITETLSAKNTNLSKQSNKGSTDSSKGNGSYDDDFEDMKSYESENEVQSDSKNQSLEEKQNSKSVQNKAFTKVSNLSFKNKIDIFEYIHSVHTQETATQSSVSSKINPKGTQTSPRNDAVNVLPIRNDLWSSIDPRGEIEKLFKLEKDFIKKIIIDEYGDILEKNISKPSTSKDIVVESDKNVIASQKNTQTSPAHVKSIMTSPTRSKARSTSPFALSVTVNKQTSPLVVHSTDEEVNVERKRDNDDLGISVNLSSPRFSLRLPQSTRDVLSNFELNTHKTATTQNNLRPNASSSSSVAEDYSSSDISSLGEIHKKYKRKIRKLKIPSISESSSASSSSKSSTGHSCAILPLKSEDSSLGQINIERSNKLSKSEGEISFGQLKW